MNSKVVWTVFPVFVLCCLVATALFLPTGNRPEEWIPLISGYCSLDFMQPAGISIAATLLFLIPICIGLFCVTKKTPVISFGYMVLFFLILILQNPRSIYFSAIYPALLCVVWMQYCFLERQIFTAFLLLSLSALFYAPIAWCIPVIMIISIVRAPDAARLLVKSLSGILVAPLYILAFRWLKFNDADVFALQYLQEIMTFDFPFHSLHLSTYFLIFCILFIAFHAMGWAFTKTLNPTLEYIIKIEAVTLIFAVALFILFYRTRSTPVLAISAVPLSVIFSYYFKNNTQKHAVRIEFILLMCALLVNALSNFVS